MEGLARPAKSAEDPYRYLGRVHARNLAEVIAINLRRLGIRLVGEPDIQATGCIGPGSANSDWFIGSAPANYPCVHRTFASRTLPRPSLALYAFGRAWWQAKHEAAMAALREYANAEKSWFSAVLLQVRVQKHVL